MRSYAQKPKASQQTARAKNTPSRANASGLHRHAAGPGPAAAPAIVHEVVRGHGRPMPAGVRRELEALLGQDFADVRVHTDERAGASAQAVAAHAYTVGRHIVFAPGRFDPGSAQGRRLLAHELTHAAGHPPGAPTPSGDLRDQHAHRGSRTTRARRVGRVRPGRGPRGAARPLPAGRRPRSSRRRHGPATTTG